MKQVYMQRRAIKLKDLKHNEMVSIEMRRKKEGC